MEKIVRVILLVALLLSITSLAYAWSWDKNLADWQKSLIITVLILGAIFMAIATMLFGFKGAIGVLILCLIVLGVSVGGAVLTFGTPGEKGYRAPQLDRNLAIRIKQEERRCAELYRDPMEFSACMDSIQYKYAEEINKAAYQQADKRGAGLLKKQIFFIPVLIVAVIAIWYILDKFLF
jgi:hypothetical protein